MQILPHRRSVPLAYEQVKAQLPTTVDYDSESDSDLDGLNKRQDGCWIEWLETYGPALTRLTANQALNVLKVIASRLFCAAAADGAAEHFMKVCC